MIRRPPRSTLDRSSAASDVYKRQTHYLSNTERNRLAHAANGNTTPGRSVPTPEEIYMQRTSAPLCTDRCHARTYNLTQCTKRPLCTEPPFCSIHRGTGSLRHGRHDGAVPAWLKADFLKTIQNRLSQSGKLKWYSRALMWKYASDTSKNSIVELEPAEFLDCLQPVSDVLRKHPA